MSHAQETRRRILVSALALAAALVVCAGPARGAEGYPAPAAREVWLWKTAPHTTPHAPPVVKSLDEMEPPAKPDTADPSKPDSPGSGGTATKKHTFDGDPVICKQLFDLPRDVVLPDGTINQPSVLGSQKARLEKTNRIFSTKFRMTETPHYLIFSDAREDITKTYTQWCEALYVNLSRQFDVGAKERVWDGKCILMVFAAPTRYADFAKRADGFPKDFEFETHPAYFAFEGYAPGMPQLVHMCFGSSSPNPQRLQCSLAHEGTHAFLKFYRTAKRIPLWVNEGLAVYMEVVNLPQFRSRWVNEAQTFARAGTPLAKVLAAGDPTEYVGDYYPVGYSLVDFLIATERTKFKKFIDAMKDGQAVDDALQATYGFNLAQMEIAWRQWVPRANLRKQGT